MLGPGPKRRRFGACKGGCIDVVSVVIGAAHVIAALLAKELALALDKAGRADRTPEHRLVLLPARGLFGFVHVADYSGFSRRDTIGAS
jgi:hypothetical protein